MNQDNRNFTQEQWAIVEQIRDVHGLEPNQISFVDDDPTPIFDYEAVCALSLKLTDIQGIDCEITSRDESTGRSNATCTVTLPDGRTRTSYDSAALLEKIGVDGQITTVREADNVAQARAVRRGIRSVGVNLWNAHKRFVATGEIVAGHTDHNPRKAGYNEIHVLATELGLIVDGDKSAYRQYLGLTFEGCESSKDLNDLDFQRLLVNLRTMANAVRRSQRAA